MLLSTPELQFDLYFVLVILVSDMWCGYVFAEDKVTSNGETIDPFGNILFSLLSSIFVIVFSMVL